MKIPSLFTTTLLLTAAITAQAKTESYLGILTVSVPDVLAAQFPDLLARGQGLVVNHVVRGSPAAGVGIRKHDVLVTYEGGSVESKEQLKARILATRPGTVVRLGVLRTGKLRAIAARLGARPATGSVDPKGKDGAGSGVTVIGQVRGFMSTNGNAPPTMVMISLDRKRFTVRVSYTDKSGKEQKRNATGSRDELLRRLDNLPGALRADVLKKLDETAALKDENALFSLRLRPLRTRDGKPRVRTTLYTVGKGGKIETLAFVAAPEVEAIASHLGGLPPKIQEKVLESLRRNEIPKVRVKVDHSL
ncbi:MAG: PDZ domain-containing protein [Planctomycetota bacterium]|jgi:hypothetical protein